MGFYYGSNQPPPEDDKPAGLRDIIAISWAVFSVLALPLGLLLGIVVYLVVLFWMFSIHWTLGVTLLLLLVGSILARGIWEAKHPPELR